MANLKEYSSPSLSKHEFTCPYCGVLARQNSLGNAKNNDKTDLKLAHESCCTFDSTNESEKFDIDTLSNPWKYNDGDYITKMKHKKIKFFHTMCINCYGITTWKVTINNLVDEHSPDLIINERFEEKIIHPFTSSITTFPNNDMAEEEQTLFNEAKNIFDESPKAAGALLRCVLESILRRIFDKPKEMLGAILNDADVKKN